MFVEHQSTSGTKIRNPDACARAVLLNYSDSESTVRIVIIRNLDACYCRVLLPGYDQVCMSACTNKDSSTFIIYRL